jgi:hypothetical protein
MSSRAGRDVMTMPPDLQRRMRGFRLHMIGFAVVIAVLAAINYFVTPEHPWFVLPMVAWGAPLAVHAAYAMGLFGRRGD